MTLTTENGHLVVGRGVRFNVNQVVTATAPSPKTSKSFSSSFIVRPATSHFRRLLAEHKGSRDNVIGTRSMDQRNCFAANATIRFNFGL